MIIKSQSRDLNIHPSTGNPGEALEEIGNRISETVFHLIKRVVEHGNIDFSAITEDGTHELFGITVFIQKEKWDYHFILESDVEYRDESE